MQSEVLEEAVRWAENVCNGQPSEVRCLIRCDSSGMETDIHEVALERGALADVAARTRAAGAFILLTVTVTRRQHSAGAEHKQHRHY